MKRSVIMVCVALVLSVMAKGQDYILLTVPDSTIAHAAKVLASDGYIIDVYHADIGQLSTQYRGIGRIEITLNIYQESNKAYLRGEMYLRDVDKVGGATAIENKGMGGSPSRKAWDELVRVAKLIKGVE